MNIDIFKHEDNWQDVKDSTMNTIGKTTGTYPDPVWKKKLLLSEHSPIRRIKFYWRWKDLKYWVSVHFVRHKIGIEHWVTTQRTDRTGIDRNDIPQGALVNHACEADAQALINISRKRLCSCASPETREAWQKVKEEVSKTEPELASCMVRECIYRGFCPEMFGCGYDKTEAFKKELEEYRSAVIEGEQKMNDEYEGFCFDCDRIVPLIFKKRRVEQTEKGISFSYSEDYAICMHCWNEVYIPRLNDRNAKARASAYFEEKVRIQDNADIFEQTYEEVTQ